MVVATRTVLTERALRPLTPVATGSRTIPRTFTARSALSILPGWTSPVILAVVTTRTVAAARPAVPLWPVVTARAVVAREPTTGPRLIIPTEAASTAGPVGTPEQAAGTGPVLTPTGSVPTRVGTTRPVATPVVRPCTVAAGPLVAERTIATTPARPWPISTAEAAAGTLPFVRPTVLA